MKTDFRSILLTILLLLICLFSSNSHLLNIFSNIADNVSVTGNTGCEESIDSTSSSWQKIKGIKGKIILPKHPEHTRGIVHFIGGFVFGEFPVGFYKRGSKLHVPQS